MPYEIELVRRMADVDRAEWNALVGDDGSPFLEWEWLAALEDSGCATAETGWAPHHVVARSRGKIVGAAPMYLKGHSQGEFVFDHSWAEAAEQAGLRYYPKLLVAVPFTPAGGRRLLTHPSERRGPLLAVLAKALREICDGNEISSIHVNFCAQDEVGALREAGFLHRNGLQYHWRNRGYERFEDYLATLRSKRRIQVRRERRSIAEAGITIGVHEGSAIGDELFEPMFRIYLSTIEKMYWGRQYLNLALFQRLSEGWKRNLCFIAARRGGELIAGAVNVQKAGVLYGRYWGAFEEVRNLHFEVCYYSGIEHCIERGLERFEPGAGGEFKYWRGFEPVLTHSMHYLPHPEFARAVRRFLERERAHLEGMVEEMRGREKPGVRA
ncbi:MAG TPA: GNAT family N-acetyltransferase [Candidatus Binatia bacterium]|nr:GNAT family N-acetyltransferase [Candidatus Binatia bacterium]